MLTTQNLCIGYEGRTIANDLNLVLESGKLVCLIGPNGVGKSTLMRTLAGMQKPCAGRIMLFGHDIHKMKPGELAKRLSIVLTQRLELGLMTGYALVAVGRHPYTDWTGQLSRADEDVIRWAVEAVDAQEIAPRVLHELSDGERQKLMIARALAQEPDIMLLDEPTAFLDLPRRVETMLLLRRLAHTARRAILLSTHDLDLALRNADKIWLMSYSGLVQVGAPEDLILSGAFERAFSRDGIHFDPHSGSFVTPQEPRRIVEIQGDGLAAIWTRRAAERAGYRVIVTAPLRIIVEAEHWVIHVPNTQEILCTSLQEVVSFLMEHGATTDNFP